METINIPKLEYILLLEFKIAYLKKLQEENPNHNCIYSIIDAENKLKELNSK